MSISKTNHTGSVQYFLCTNGADIYHPVVLEPGNTLETGQSTIEQFENKTKFLERLEKLGYPFEEL